jgi:hypothetical protein
VSISGILVEPCSYESGARVQNDRVLVEATPPVAQVLD